MHVSPQTAESPMASEATAVGRVRRCGGFSVGHASTKKVCVLAHRPEYSYCPVHTEQDTGRRSEADATYRVISRELGVFHDLILANSQPLRVRIRIERGKIDGHTYLQCNIVLVLVFSGRDQASIHALSCEGTFTSQIVAEPMIPCLARLGDMLFSRRQRWCLASCQVGPAG